MRIIRGQFKTITDDTVNVIFTNVSSSDDETIYIGQDDSSKIYFAEDPLTISMEDEDIDTCIIPRKCTVRLVTSIDLSDYLFTLNPWEIRIQINIIRNGIRWIYDGYVQPLSFNQDFSQKWNEIEIECIDYLGTLQYKPFLNTDWGTAVSSSTICPFIDTITNNILSGADVYITGINNEYEQFNTIEHNVYNLTYFGCNQLALLGEKEDEHKSCADALEAILKYLGLKITTYLSEEPSTGGGYQRHYVIFDKTLPYLFPEYYGTLFGGKCSFPIVFEHQYNLVKTTDVSYTNINSGYIDAQYDISMSEPITKIKVNVDRKEVESIIPNVFEDFITTYAAGRVKFLTEYSTSYDYSGNKFKALITNRAEVDPITGQKLYPLDHVNDDSAWMRTWYILLLQNEGWSIYDKSGNDVTVRGGYQSNVLSKLERHGEQYPYGSYAPVLCNIYKEDKRTKKNSTKELSVSENRILLFPINGNRKDTENEHIPNTSDLVYHSADGCMMKFTSTAEVNISPSDENAVNYLIFTGNIGYAPLERTSYIINGPNSGRTSQYNTKFSNIVYGCENNYSSWLLIPTSWNKTESKRVTYPLIANGAIDTQDGRRFYAQAFSDDGTEAPDKQFFVPMTEDSDNVDKLYKYNYSQTGDDNSEKIDKIPMLQCSLQIGDKLLQETFVDAANGYKVSKYEWVDAYTNPNATFSLGISPERDDFIIGTFYEFKNDIPASTGIKTKGMGIPIRKEDNLHGPLVFKIISALTPQYDKNSHKTKISLTPFDRKWRNSAEYVLSHVSSICMKSFKISIESGDNADKINVKDLCYMSAEGLTYIKNEKEIDFDLCSALSLNEANTLNVENGIYTNIVYFIDTDENNETRVTPTDYILKYDYSHVRAEKSFIEKWYDIVSNVRRIYKIKVKDTYDGFSKNFGEILNCNTFTLYDSSNQSYTDAIIKDCKSVEYDVKNCEFVIEGSTIDENL